MASAPVLVSKTYDLMSDGGLMADLVDGNLVLTGAAEPGVYQVVVRRTIIEDYTRTITVTDSGDTPVPLFSANFLTRNYGNRTEAEALSLLRSSVATYPLSTVPLVTYSPDQPRFDDGLFVEPESRNLTVNPTFAGGVIGVVGSGGTTPTGMDWNIYPVREILSISDIDGMRVMRVRISRSGGSPSGQFPTLRFCGGTGPVVTGPGVAGSAWVRIINASDSVSSVKLIINSGGINDSDSGSPINKSLLNEWQRGVVVRSGGIGSNSQFNLAFTLSSATVDFDFTIDVGLHQLENIPAGGVPSPPTTMLPVTGTRAADVAKLLVPTGTYDRLVISGLTDAVAQPVWTDDVVITDGDTLPALAATVRRNRHRRYAAFAAGLSADAKNIYLDNILPAQWSDNLPYATNYPIFGGFMQTQTAMQPWSLKRATNRVNMYRFELREGDIVPSIDGPGSAKDRCELSGVSVPYGAEHWFAFDILFPVLPDKVTDSYMTVCQFHDSADGVDTIGAPPPFDLNLTPEGNRWKVGIAGSAQNPLTSWGAVVMEDVYTGLDRVQAGRLYRWVIAVREGYDGSGTIKAWLDGAQVVNASGRIIGYNNVSGSYIKFGLYRGRYAATLSSIVSNFTQSSASLIDRVANSMPQ